MFVVVLVTYELLQHPQQCDVCSQVERGVKVPTDTTGPLSPNGSSFEHAVSAFTEDAPQGIPSFLFSRIPEPARWAAGRRIAIWRKVHGSNPRYSLAAVHRIYALWTHLQHWLLGWSYPLTRRCQEALLHAEKKLEAHGHSIIAQTVVFVVQIVRVSLASCFQQVSRYGLARSPDILTAQISNVNASLAGGVTSVKSRLLNLRDERGVHVGVKIDTGATCSVSSVEYLNSIGLKLTPPPPGTPEVFGRLANGAPVPLKGTAILSLRLVPMEEPREIVVHAINDSDPSDHVLIGACDLVDVAITVRANGAMELDTHVADPEPEQLCAADTSNEGALPKVHTEPFGPELAAKVLALFKEYHEVWQPPGKDPSTLSPLVITLTDEAKNLPPYHATPRKVPAVQAKALAEQIAEQVKLGFLEKIDEKEALKSFISAPHVVPKPHTNKWRMVINFIELNKATKREHHPIPAIGDLLAFFKDKKYFGKVDLFSGFNQMLVDPASRQYLTIVSPNREYYRYTRLPFGITNGPIVFQRAMQELFADIEGVRVYIDDVALAASTPEQFLSTLRAFLQRCQDNHLHIRGDKSEFLPAALSFLGLRVSEDGVTVDPERVADLLRLSEPRTKAQLLTFLGAANYYAKFIPQFAVVSACLYDLLKAHVVFKWEAKHTIAFRTLLQAIASAPILAHRDPAQQLIIRTDASIIGIGGVILQRDPITSVTLPLAYFARRLQPAERKYNVTELEALALLTGLRKARDFLTIGGQVLCITDHSNLAWMRTSSNKRVQRWSHLLSEYDTTILYQPGASNVIADALSRLPPEHGDSSIPLQSPEVPSGQPEPAGDPRAVSEHMHVYVPTSDEAQGKPPYGGLLRGNITSDPRAIAGHRKLLIRAGKVEETDSDYSTVSSEYEAELDSVEQCGETHEQRSVRFAAMMRADLQHEFMAHGRSETLDLLSELDRDAQNVVVSTVAQVGADEPFAPKSVYDCTCMACKQQSARASMITVDVPAATASSLSPITYLVEASSRLTRHVIASLTTEVARSVLSTSISEVAPGALLELLKSDKTPYSLDEQTGVIHIAEGHKPSTEFVKRVFALAHSHPMASHPGINRTYTHIIDVVTWPGIRDDIVKLVRACPLCQHHHAVTRPVAAQGTTLQYADAPFQCVFMDFLSISPPSQHWDYPKPKPKRGRPKTGDAQGEVEVEAGPASAEAPVELVPYKYVLVFIDRFTRWVELIPTTAATADIVVKAFHDHWVTHFGYPRVLASDRGSHFSNDQVAKMCETLGIEHHEGTAYNHRSQGVVERNNRTIRAALVAWRSEFTHEASNEWHTQLPAVKFALNSARNALTGISAFEAALGFQPRTPLAHEAATVASTVAHVQAEHKDAETFEERFRIVVDSIRAKHKAAYAKILAAYQQNQQHLPVFEIGQYCLVHNEQPADKLAWKWHGPYLVLEDIGARGLVFLVRDLEDDHTFQVQVERMAHYDASALMLPDGSFDDRYAKILMARSQGRWYIDSVLGHEWRTGGLYMRVLWSGFEEYAESDPRGWVPYSDVSHLHPVQQYVREHPTCKHPPPAASAASAAEPAQSPMPTAHAAATAKKEPTAQVQRSVPEKVEPPKTKSGETTAPAQRKPPVVAKSAAAAVKATASKQQIATTKPVPPRVIQTRASAAAATKSLAQSAQVAKKRGRPPKILHDHAISALNVDDLEFSGVDEWATPHRPPQREFSPADALSFAIERAEASLAYASKLDGTVYAVTRNPSHDTPSSVLGATIASLARPSYALASLPPGAVDSDVPDQDPKLLRSNVDRGDWQLDPDIFRQLSARWGVPEVDRFATRRNRQVPRFWAAIPEKDAEGVDAFSVSWEGAYNYINPPFANITPVIDKLQRESKASAIVVVPYWPESEWWASLCKLADDVVIIPRRHDTFRPLSELNMRGIGPPPWPVLAFHIPAGRSS